MGRGSAGVGTDVPHTVCGLHQEGAWRGRPTGRGECPPSPRPAAQPSSAPPEQTLPAETLPAETLPAETLPAETLPAETLPAETLPRRQLPEVAPEKDTELAAPPAPPGETFNIRETGIWIHTFPGANDDERLTAAIDEQKRSASTENMPPMILPYRTFSVNPVTNRRTLYNGLKLIGPHKTGQKNPEISGGNLVGSEIVFTAANSGLGPDAVVGRRRVIDLRCHDGRLLDAGIAGLGTARLRRRALRHPLRLHLRRHLGQLHVRHVRPRQLEVPRHPGDVAGRLHLEQLLGTAHAHRWLRLQPRYGDVQHRGQWTSGPDRQPQSLLHQTELGPRRHRRPHLRHDEQRLEGGAHRRAIDAALLGGGHRGLQADGKRRGRSRSWRPRPPDGWLRGLEPVRLRPGDGAAGPLRARPLRHGQRRGVPSTSAPGTART